MKVSIYWITNDWNLIRRIREKYRIPQQMNINYITYAEVDEETLAQLKNGEPKFLIIRKLKMTQIEFMNRLIDKHAPAVIGCTYNILFTNDIAITTVIEAVEAVRKSDRYRQETKRITNVIDRLRGKYEKMLFEVIGDRSGFSRTLTRRFLKTSRNTWTSSTTASRECSTRRGWKIPPCLHAASWQGRCASSPASSWTSAKKN